MPSHGHRPTLHHRAAVIIRALRSLALLAALALGAAPPVGASTAAGTVITNTASATYVDAPSGIHVRLNSNTVSTVVQPYEALELAAPQTISRVPGGTFALPHVLTNTGNVATHYLLSVAAAGGGFVPAALQLTADTNGNGIADPGEPVLTGGAVTLSAGAAMNLLITGIVPASATLGSAAQVKLVAVSQLQAASASNVDTLELAGGAVVTVTKSASVAAASPNDSVSYQLVVQNSGAAAAGPVAVTVDGTTAARFVLRDALPANTSFNGATAVNGGATLVYHRAGDAAGSYTSAAPPAAAIDAIAIVLPELAANAGAGVTFGVTVHGNATGTLSNTAYADFTAGGGATTVASNAVQLPLPTLAPTILFFTNAAYTTAANQTALGAPVFLQINAAQCNTDPTSIVTRPITLVSALTGDSETFMMVETGANTGIFRIVPSVPTASAATRVVAAGDGVLEVLPDDHVTATLTACGATAVTAVLLVDPSGIVFDSRTNLPVMGATVELIDVTGAGNGGHPGGAATVLQSDGTTPGSATVTTAMDGRYSFPLVPPSSYRLRVLPPNGYAFPSKLPPALQPAGRNIALDGSYGAPFALSTRGPLMLDLPLDSAAAAGLFIQKLASASTASLGDFIDYSITINDNTPFDFASAQLHDRPPAGFAYVGHSARLGALPVAEPSGLGTAVLTFEVGPLHSGANSVLTYRLHVGPGAQSGTGTNTAQAVSGQTASNVASAHVQVAGGVLSDKAYLIGKVYADCNHDRVQQDDEDGIPGVRIYLDDGTYAITDSEGKYSLYGLTPRTHVVKLDVTTLPKGAHLEILDHRNALDAGSRFADLRIGELQKADFAIGECRLDLHALLAERRAKLQELPGEIYSLATDKAVLASPGATGGSGVGAASDPRALPASGLIGGRTVRSADDTVPPRAATLGTATAGAAGSVAIAQQVAANELVRGRQLPSSLAAVLQNATPELAFIDFTDGQILPTAQTRVRIKGPLEARLQLAVNGTRVELSQVGEQSRLESRGATAWEYVGIALRAGANTLTATALDGFGNVRETRSVQVIAPGELAAIHLSTAGTSSADANAPVDVVVSLVDAHGVPVTARTPVTLEATVGKWQVTDLDPKEPGTQVFIENGSAHFVLLAPPVPGKGTLRASSGAMHAAADITFLPHLRPLIAAGVLEGTFGVHGANPGSRLAGQGTDTFERDLAAVSSTFGGDGRDSAAAQASLFVKGEIPGSNLLTLSFDSDKPSDTSLLRDIQPNTFYPVYGDSSVKGFEAQATSKLYARIDHGTSSVLYGDFTTQSDSPARVLTQYSRVLNGAKTHLELGGTSVDAFASEADTTQVVDEIPANGTSGPYRLTALNALLNSQQVEIVTRDRNQPAIVIANQTLAQFTDYAVEPEIGELLLKAPVPSVDGNLNPNFIRVTYEVGTGGPKYWVGGIDVRERILRGVTMEGTFIKDTNTAGVEDLDGLNVLWQPGAATTLVAEVARSRSALEEGGNAERIELKHIDPKLQIKAYAVQTDSSFDNPSSTYTAGASAYGAKLGYLIDPKDRLVVEALRTTSAARGAPGAAMIEAAAGAPGVTAPSAAAAVVSGVAQNGENVALEHNLTTTVKLTAGMRHVDSDTTEFTSARVRVDAPVPDVPKAAAFAQYEAALDSTGREAATAGATYQLGAQSKLYAMHESSDALSGSYGASAAEQHYTSVLGIDTAYMKDGQLFNEYRVNDGIDGRSDEAALGLRNLWRLAPGLSLSTSAQQIKPLSGAITDQSTALTAALQYTANPLWKGSTRVEWSESATTRTWLSSAAVAAKLDDSYTLLARDLYDEQIATGIGGGGVHEQKVQLGLAVRPVTSDEWNGLALIEYKRAANTALGQGLESNERAYILSNHLNVQPTADWVVNGRYGIKWAADFVGDIPSRGIVQLLGARSVWDLNARWDLGVQCYGEFSPAALGGRQLAVGAEIGYLVVRNVWLSVGYNVEGFRDPDLAGDDYTQRSFYMRLRFKFDENLFKPRNNAEPVPASVPVPP